MKSYDVIVIGGGPVREGAQIINCMPAQEDFTAGRKFGKL